MGGQQKQMLQMSLTRHFSGVFLLCVSPADFGRVKPAGLALAGS